MSFQLERKTITLNIFAGLFNLMNIELQNWFKTRKIFMHVCLWAILLFGLVVIAGINEYTANSSVEMFLNFTGVFGAIGVIISAQNVIIGERKNGVTPWLLSKPISRTSYIISKFFGNLSGFFIAMSLIPSLLIFIYISIRSTQLFSFNRLFGFMGFVIIYFSFYLSITIMLGSFFRNRGAVAGIPVGIFFAQSLLSGVLPKQAPYFPNNMLSGDEAVSSVIGNYFFNGTVTSYGSLISASVLTLCFIAIAIWRFNIEEL